MELKDYTTEELKEELKIALNRGLSLVMSLKERRIMMENLSKGRKVYIVPEDTRSKPFEATIISVGRKYITIDAYNYRFNAQVKRFPIPSVEDYSGWNPCLDLYLSKEHYQQSIENSKMCSFLKQEITRFITNEDMQDANILEKIYNFIKQIKDERG